MESSNTFSKPTAKTVCGGMITEPDRYPSVLHRGQRVYFCHQACLRAYETDPDRFIAGEVKHPPSPDESSNEPG